jgi:hypothetical protein
MDTTSLMLSMLYGTIGLGFFMYGKKAARLVPMISGASLMICPYFIPNTAIMSIVCIALAAVPYFLRST